MLMHYIKIILWKIIFSKASSGMKLPCDNCGKWVMIIRSTPAALQAAEEREQSVVTVDESKQTDAGPDQDHLLDDTRCVDNV